MQPRSKLVKYGAVIAIGFCLAGCATSRVATVSDLEASEGAFSVPYQISASGRFLIDVSINDGAARPFSVDTGATVSVIYSDYAKAADIQVTDRTLFVRGLVGQGDRPVIEDVAFTLGPKTYPLDQVVMLETPRINDAAAGLLGGDILAGHIVLFNQSEMIATFVPRQNLDPAVFSGWREIPLKTLTDTNTNADLYFAQAVFGRRRIPVLIDTGSNLNFINWKLATMDDDIRRLERKMIREGRLQGALDSTPATVGTIFYDLKLGGQHWDEVPVVITGLHGLASLAPVDKPMMVGGANLFAPHTVAFDLDGRRIYVYPSDEISRSGEPS